MTNRYDDIIHLSPPVSTRHTPMSRENRAAQFAPFAALTGYEDAVRETARMTDAKVAPTEEQMARINRALNTIHTRRDHTTVWEVTYFLADRKKQGGAYVTRRNTVRDINPASRVLILADHTEIPFSDILSLRVAEEESSPFDMLPD